MKKCSATLLFSILSFPSSQVYALCTASNVAVNFSDNINAQRDSAVGTVLATVTTTSDINCTKEGLSGIENSWYIQLAPSNIDYGASGLFGIRNTNIPGIGIKWSNTTSNTGATGVVTQRALNADDWRRGIAAEGITTLTDQFELIKTKPQISSGTLPLNQINIQYSTPITSSVNREPLFLYTIPRINIKALSCQVIDTNLNVNLGIALFKYFNGIGSTANTKKFSIGLNCDTGTSVNVTLDNVNPLANANDGVLSLNDDSTTKGIGVQVRYNNTPVKFGQSIKYGIAPSQGNINIPFDASFYQTENTIVPGQAKATATFTMTYQ